MVKHPLPKRNLEVLSKAVIPKTRKMSQLLRLESFLFNKAHCVSAKTDQQLLQLTLRNDLLDRNVKTEHGGGGGSAYSKNLGI